MGATEDAGAVSGDVLEASLRTLAADPRVDRRGGALAASDAWTAPQPVGTRGNADATPDTERGERIHWLLEQLAPPAEVDDTDWLRARLGVSEVTFAPLLAAAREILSTPALRRFFDPDQYVRARNELAFIGGAGELRRMDRVVEFETEVWVLDYKTGTPPPVEMLDTAVVPHRPQMEEYARALRTLLPGRPVRAMLIFAGGLHVEVPLTPDSSGGDVTPDGASSTVSRLP